MVKLVQKNRYNPSTEDLAYFKKMFEDAQYDRDLNIKTGTYIEVKDGTLKVGAIIVSMLPGESVIIEKGNVVIAGENEQTFICKLK